MSFKQNKISSKKIWIIDIWSYKIRVWICKIKNWEVKLLWYWEKRQNNQDLLLGDFLNVKWVCENISLAIEKAEKESWIKINDLVINIPFDDIFIESDKINYKRKNIDKPIDKIELQNIITEVKRKSLSLSLSKITEKSSYEKEDLHLIVSNISKIEIDNKLETNDIIWENWENITISNLNIYIPVLKYDTINYIWKALNKNIFKIIPNEFSVTKLFREEKDLVILDVWARYISITVKKAWIISWTSKLLLWMNDLVKKIQENNNKTRIEIINSIDKDIYKDEKEEFLNVFEDCLYMWLENILWDNCICPNKFFLLWGWDNKFIREYLKNIKLNTYKIKLTKSIEFVDLKLDNFEKISSKSNLNLISMILTTLDLVKKENDKLTLCIEKAIKEITGN